MQQSKLGYPYSYGDELTPEMSEENIKKLVMILLLFWLRKFDLLRFQVLMGLLLDLIHLDVVETKINAEIMEFFQEQQHQQVVSSIIINRIGIMNRP